MEIESIWANAYPHTGEWFGRIYCRKWHQKLRRRLIVWLLKSMAKEDSMSYVRIDTGVSNAFWCNPVESEL